MNRMGKEENTAGEPNGWKEDTVHSLKTHQNPKKATVVMPPDYTGRQTEMECKEE